MDMKGIFLKHSNDSPLKGIMKAGHKYIERFGTPGNYRYVYGNISDNKSNNTNSDYAVGLSNHGERVYLTDSKRDQETERRTTNLKFDIREVNDTKNFAESAKERAARNRLRNCGACTMAFELRSRGYDVQATDFDEGTTLITLNNIFKKSDGSKPMKEIYTAPTLWPFDKKNTITSEAIESIKTNLYKYPDRSRGAIQIRYYIGGGHVLNWERMGDLIVFYDGQSDDRFIMSKDTNSIPNDFSLHYARNIAVGRLDDCDININSFYDEPIPLPGIDKKRKLSDYVEPAKKGSYNKANQKYLTQDRRVRRKQELKRKYRTTK